MRFLSTSECMRNARQEGVAIPAFNIPDLPMMEPVVEALRSTDSFGLMPWPGRNGSSSRPRVFARSLRNINGSKMNGSRGCTSITSRWWTRTI